MRHVDDGTIHAWLDEQITDPAEAAWVEAHLRECGPCRARLVDEQATFDRAQALLAGAAPAAEQPSFDALVAQAGGSRTDSGTASDRGRTARWLVPASWAASLALAVGLGWAARALTDVEPDPQVIASPAMEPPAAPDAPAADSAAPQRRAEVSPARPAAPAPESARSASAAKATQAMAPLAAGPVPTAMAAPAPAAPPAAAPPPALAPPFAPSLRQETFTGDSVAVAAPPVDAVWRPLPRTEAAARTGMPLYGIDGLEPQYTALSADGARVRTLYRLASGELVELIQQPIALDSLSSLADVQATRRAFTGGGAGRGGVVADRVAAAPRTRSIVRGGVRITLETTSGGADLDALGTRLRVD
jgi:hypothetical protein